MCERERERERERSALPVGISEWYAITILGGMAHSA